MPESAMVNVCLLSLLATPVANLHRPGVHEAMPQIFRRTAVCKIRVRRRSDTRAHAHFMHGKFVNSIPHSILIVCVRKVAKKMRKTLGYMYAKFERSALSECRKRGENVANEHWTCVARLSRSAHEEKKSRHLPFLVPCRHVIGLAGYVKAVLIAANFLLPDRLILCRVIHARSFWPPLPPVGLLLDPNPIRLA